VALATSIALRLTRESAYCPMARPTAREGRNLTRTQRFFPRGTTMSRLPKWLFGVLACVAYQLV
jgi:hypothetical protein